MGFSITLPKYLKGGIVSDLKKIALACVDLLLFDQKKIKQLKHINSTTKTLIDIHWDDLPIKPPLEPEDRQSFIILYEDYLEYLGSDRGINLTKNMYNLTFFECVAIKESSLSYLYPYQFLRVRLNWQTPDILERIRVFLRRVAPAVSKFHTQLLPPRSTKGYGRKRGRTYGRS